MDNRVVFDFEIHFTNGGNMKGEGFRLDIEGDDIGDAALIRCLISDLWLLMVGEARIYNKKIIAEPHKRNSGHAPVFIDLSHTIEHGLVTYKGLPAPVICDYLSREDSRRFYEEGTEFQIGKIEMVANTGTYVDCPFHRFEHGEDLSEVGLERFAGLDGIVISIPCSEVTAISESHLRGFRVRDRAVLIHTGWAARWNTELYYENHPFLTLGAAEYLRDNHVRLVGIDSHNIDDTRGKTRPAHTALLGAGILIVEHLCNLDQLPDEGFLFSAVPPKFKGVGTFPVRAMAEIRI